MTTLLFALTLIAVALLARRFAPAPLDAVTRVLSGRWVPLAFGLLAGAMVWWIWGGLSQPPLYQDERAYVLQAQLFAMGRWTGPGRPMPEFFEQAHVLVSPVLASKYFPGHSLLLAPGALLGMPGLVVVLLSVLTGTLVFGLARRATNPWVALLGGVIWIGAPNNFGWRATYFSEVTTGATCLVAFWALLEWREHRRARHLALAAAMVALTGITRPLTGVALALPVAVLVLRDAWRGRLWRQLPVALAPALLVAGLVPLWSARTTGDWRVTPHGVYTREYMPYDHLGFGFDSTPPSRVVPVDIAKLNSFYRDVHEPHTLAALPRTIYLRVLGIAVGMFGLWWAVLLPVTLLSFLALGPELRFAAAVAGCELAAYLLYAHPPAWTLYYQEVFPVFAVLCALGLWRVLDVIEHGTLGALRLAPARLPDAQRALGALGVMLVLLWPATISIVAAHGASVTRALHFRRFDKVVAWVPTPRAILFVRYGPSHDEHVSYIGNAANPDAERVWTAYDRGADDLRLMQAFPDRQAFVFDEATVTVGPLRFEQRGPSAGDGGASKAPPPSPGRP